MRVPVLFCSEKKEISYLGSKSLLQLDKEWLDAVQYKILEWCRVADRGTPFSHLLIPPSRVQYF